MSNIYTTLEAPVELRKDILKANIKIIEMMEDFESIKELKHNKHRRFLFLKAYMQEINSALTGLRMRFPHVKFDEEDKLKKESEKINIEFDNYVKPDKAVDKLEKELFMLREKLKDMG